MNRRCKTLFFLGRNWGASPFSLFAGMKIVFAKRKMHYIPFHTEKVKKASKAWNGPTKSVRQNVKRELKRAAKLHKRVQTNQINRGEYIRQQIAL